MSRLRVCMGAGAGRLGGYAVTSHRKGRRSHESLAQAVQDPVWSWCKAEPELWGQTHQVPTPEAAFIVTYLASASPSVKWE